MNYANIRAIEFDDIQLLRYWRNLDHVRARMEMTNSIEVEEQRRWFERINADTSKHFIYSLGVRDIGSININNINYDELITPTGPNQEPSTAFVYNPVTDRRFNLTNCDKGKSSIISKGENLEFWKRIALGADVDNV